MAACIAFQCNSGENGESSVSSPHEKGSFEYYQSGSGCAPQIDFQLLLDSSVHVHDTIPIPDIVVSGIVLSVADSSVTLIDSLGDGWVNETMSKHFVYRADVDEWVVGSSDLESFSVTARSKRSSVQSRSVFEELTEEGDSVYMMEIKAVHPGSNSTNIMVPHGTRCVFHFSDSAMTDLQHIASYTDAGLREYLSREGLDRAARP